LEVLQQIARPNDGDAVRLRVLDAAEVVFAERGYRAATTREIAERAGIGKRMLFYYFPNKDAVYRAVLERVITGLVEIHERFRDDPATVGVGEAIEGLTHFAAANLTAFKVWMREIIDGGPHLDSLVRQYIAPLFARGGAEVERNMIAGTFRPGDPMHMMVSVGGVSLFYFLLLPLLELVWDRDPLDPVTITERAVAARDCLLHGLTGPVGQGGNGR
jgi:TetR/AcrR family transcriptional regulator